MKETSYKFRLKDSILGIQFLFVAFGALVLVPILTGLDPNVALFTAGLGTLVFQLINRKNVPPIFLASSFAFIAPISYGVQTWGIAGTMSGLVAAGLFYIVLSFLVRLKGSGFLHKLLPAIVVGPVIMSIGLILSPVAVNMAMGKTGDGAIQLVPAEPAMIISMTALFVTLFISLLGKGIFKLIPILGGIIIGYIVALFYGIVDLLSVIPELIALIIFPYFMGTVWLRVFKLFRILRVLKVVRVFKNHNGIIGKLIPYVAIAIAYKGIIVIFENENWWINAKDLTLVISVIGFSLAVLLGTKLHVVNNRIYQIEDALCRIVGSLVDMQNTISIQKSIFSWSSLLEETLKFSRQYHAKAFEKILLSAIE